jgi:hypothetical protein
MKKKRKQMKEIRVVLLSLHLELDVHIHTTAIILFSWHDRKQSKQPLSPGLPIAAAT